MGAVRLRFGLGQENSDFMNSPHLVDPNQKLGIPRSLVFLGVQKRVLRKEKERSHLLHHIPLCNEVG